MERWLRSFGAAEELTNKQIDEMIATSLVGSIQLVCAVLPHLRAKWADGWSCRAGAFRPR
jgi:NAD(P)-dependent dehydrogenase (short-subunit alcohol dehydrogenase family)